MAAQNDAMVRASLVEQISEFVEDGHQSTRPPPKDAPEGVLHGFTTGDDLCVLQSEVNRLAPLRARKFALSKSQGMVKTAMTALETVNEMARTPFRLRGFSDRVIAQVKQGRWNATLNRLWRMYQLDGIITPGVGVMIELFAEMIDTHAANAPPEGVQDGREFGVEKIHAIAARVYRGVMSISFLSAPPDEAAIKESEERWGGAEDAGGAGEASPLPEADTLDLGDWGEPDSPPSTPTAPADADAGLAGDSFMIT